jgi:iron(III) transport system substrate-binding protein
MRGDKVVMKHALIALTVLFFTSLSEAQSLYDAAKKEGKVVIYARGDEDFRRIVQVFNRRYPDVTVEAQEMRGQEAREKIIAEQAAKQLVVDIISGGENSIAELRQLGYLEQYRSPELKFIQKDSLDPLGFRNPVNLNVYGFTINTNVITSTPEPKSWSDLIHPRFQGKLATQDPRGSGGSLYLMTALSRVYGMEFVRKLAKQNIFFGRNTSALLTGLVRGEHGVLMSTSWGSAPLQKAIKGKAPIKFIKPLDGLQIIPISMAIVKNAPHPNAAKLLIDWSLSEEGQKAEAAEGATPARIGIAARDPEGDIRGAKVLPSEDWTTKPELVKEMTKHWEEIFFKK